MNPDTLKKLHNVMLEIMNEFVFVCKENNLTYFLTGGTLLGAVRHKGFIPWDDDMDIGMPRDDYEKFIEIYDKIKETNYYVLSHLTKNNIGNYYRDFSKLCKKGTVLAEGDRHPDYYSGIYIDIFPFDNCVLFFASLQTRLIKIALKLCRLKSNVEIPKNKVKLVISKILCCFYSLSFMDTLHKRLHTLFNKNKTKYISFFSGIWGYKKETHEYEEIFPLSELEFEEKCYYVPCKWDPYLTRVYGNYMELPPVEDRRTHEHLFIKFDDNE
jgi:lipopolysaccharide cholinephosphotransferase